MLGDGWENVPACVSSITAVVGRRIPFGPAIVGECGGPDNCSIFVSISAFVSVRKCVVRACCGLAMGIDGVGLFRAGGWGGVWERGRVEWCDL